MFVFTLVLFQQYMLYIHFCQISNRVLHTTTIFSLYMGLFLAYNSKNDSNNNNNNNNNDDFITVSITSSSGESPMLIGDT